MVIQHLKHLLGRTKRLNIASVCLIAAVTCVLASGEATPAVEEQVYSPNAFKVPYLGVDGAFTIDTEEISAQDPRNPKRVVFQQMEYFSFYQDLDGYTPIAQNCR